MELGPTSDKDKTNSPVVSIIIPTYNEEKYVNEVLHSISNQSYDNIEIIIVDGGSTDGTIEKIDNFVNESPYKIQVFINEPSINQSFARNRGLMHADGEYIVFHDADDLSFPDRINKQVHFLEDNPEFGVVGSSFYYINPLRGEETIRERPTGHGQICQALARSCPIHIGSAMFRREALAQTHLFKSGYAEVYEILIDLAAKEWKLSNISEPLFIYRINEDSISRSGEIRQKMVLVKRSYQAVSRLNLPKYNLILSLGWFLYAYSPITVKYFLRQIFAPDEDSNISDEREKKLEDFLNKMKQI